MLARLRQWLGNTPEGVPLNLAMGLLAFVVGLIQAQPQLILLGACYTAAFLLVSVRLRWARYALVILFLFMGARLIANAFWYGPSLIRLFGSGFCLWMAMDAWRRYSPENLGDVIEQPFALVLLVAKPRKLEGEELARLLESSWGGQFAYESAEENATGVEEADTEDDRQFIVGKEGHFMVHSRRGWFLVHNVAEPYWTDDTDVVAEMHEDMRSAQIVRDHQAWLSIDLLRVGQSDDEQALQLRAMGKFIATLADDETLGLLRPDLGQLNAWGPVVKDHLERGQVDAAIYELNEPPVISIADDNQQLLDGVAEAKRRWPEFVAAYANHDQARDNFAVKAPVTRSDVTEFIWMEITKLDAGRVHGTLQNEPVNLGSLKLGDPVEIAAGDINDWVYSLGSQPPVGLFTLAAFDTPEEG